MLVITTLLRYRERQEDLECGDGLSYTCLVSSNNNNKNFLKVHKSQVWGPERWLSS